MGPLEIENRLRASFSDQIIEVLVSRNQPVAIVKSDQILAICQWLRDDPRLQMNHLMDLCGVDCSGLGKDYFEVVYNLYSISQHHMLRLKARVPTDDCRINSVTTVWKGANWHERECFDLLGIVFDGHPDMRRILLPDDWQGYPLRKDYPLQLSKADEYEGFNELKIQAKRLGKFDFFPDSQAAQTNTDPH